MNLSTNPFYSSLETRRSFLGKGTTGVGLAALAGLLNQDRALGKSIGDFTFPNFAPKAKRVVVLWQGGGPSHIDLLDPKPTLTKMAGKDIPNSPYVGIRVFPPCLQATKHGHASPKSNPIKNTVNVEWRSAQCSPILEVMRMIYVL